MVVPLTIRAFDKTFAKKGDIGRPKFVTINQRFNAVSTATISVLGIDPMISTLADDGGRLWVRDGSGAHVISGWVTEMRATGPKSSSTFEFDIDDDFGVLDEVLGWVIPENDIESQGEAGTNWTMSDHAETVLKAAVTANAVNRLGMPITVAPDLGRGAVIDASLRWEPLYSKLFPVVDGCGLTASGIGVTVQQEDDHLLLDVYETSEYPKTLSEAGGQVVDWSYSKKAPTATRVVVGGPGEGVLRSLRTVTDSARETQYGHIIERWRDARDVDPGDPTLLYPRGQQTLDDGAPKSSLSLTLAETRAFKVSDVRVGDLVHVDLGNGVVIDDVLSEVLLSWTQDAGWKVTPRVGDRSDDPDAALGTVISRLTRAFSRTQRT